MDTDEQMEEEEAPQGEPERQEQIASRVLREIPRNELELRDRHGAAARAYRDLRVQQLVLQDREDAAERMLQQVQRLEREHQVEQGTAAVVFREMRQLQRNQRRVGRMREQAARAFREMGRRMQRQLQQSGNEPGEIHQRGLEYQDEAPQPEPEGQAQIPQHEPEQQTGPSQREPEHQAQTLQHEPEHQVQAPHESEHQAQALQLQPEQQAQPAQHEPENQPQAEMPMETNGNAEVINGQLTSNEDDADKQRGWYLRFLEMTSMELPSETVKHLVLDFLISQGYREAAERLCEDASIPFPRDAMDNLDQRMRIRDDIVDGKIQEAIEKVTTVVPDLLERNPVLHLRLLQQHLIELIRNRLVEEAVAFTQSIVEKVDDHPEMEKEMQKAFAMIAFEKPEDSPYTYLLEISHRQMVANDVNRAILEALNKPSAPRLETLFRLILWSRNHLKKDDTPESLDLLFSGQF